MRAKTWGIAGALLRKNIGDCWCFVFCTAPFFAQDGVKTTAAKTVAQTDTGDCSFTCHRLTCARLSAGPAQASPNSTLPKKNKSAVDKDPDHRKMPKDIGAAHREAAPATHAAAAYTYTPLSVSLSSLSLPPSLPPSLTA